MTHELPKVRLALVLLVALLVSVVLCERGSAITSELAHNGYGPSYAMGGPVPPWEWTADEWRQTVWPSK